MAPNRLRNLAQAFAREALAPYLPISRRDLSPPRAFLRCPNLPGHCYYYHSFPSTSNQIPKCIFDFQLEDCKTIEFPLSKRTFRLTHIVCLQLKIKYTLIDSFLTLQKKHLELARDANDLVEQQRASTQLGRTYHELFSRSDHDHNSIRNAKKYFKCAMDLAVTLKENPPNNKSSFLKEYVDAHNNIGMLEMDLDNLHEAQKILTRGLEICDEEEISEYDDGRSRLHHNLGNVYMELRIWDEARKNIKRDIQICNRIGHCQGEAKGYINLGEVHYRTQKYEEARSYYEKALALAKSLEDEDALVRQINQNIQTVKEAVKVMDEIKREEQNLKKLKRDIANVRGTSNERKCLLQQNASLDRLVEKARMISSWEKVAILSLCLCSKILFN